MATKLELQQTNTKLAADNLALREQLSVVTTEKKTAEASVIELLGDIERQKVKINHLTRLLAEADARTKRVISAANHERKHRNLDRVAAMEEAKRMARESGLTTKVTF